MKKDQNIYIFTERLQQNTYTETKKAHSLINTGKRFII